MRIGIDLGGTKIEGIVLDGDGHALHRLRVATPAGDYPGTIAAITGVVDELERRVGCRASVGVGIPGTVSPASGVIKNANSTWIIGRPLDHDLGAALGRPVRIANDANCFAVSEAIDGAAAGARVVFGVILGTGVGGGIVVDEQMLAGINAIAGEWGHNPLPWMDDNERPGHLCYCGKLGCVETFLSGPGLARDYQAATGRNRSAADIAADVGDGTGRGDSAAVAALERYEERLAKALASVINVLDPDVIVLGGGMSNVKRLYETVPRHWQHWVFSDRADTRLVRNTHGDSSGVRGAAWLWPPGEGA